MGISIETFAIGVWCGCSPNMGPSLLVLDEPSITWKWALPATQALRENESMETNPRPRAGASAGDYVVDWQLRSAWELESAIRRAARKPALPVRQPNPKVPAVEIANSDVPLMHHERAGLS